MSIKEQEDETIALKKIVLRIEGFYQIISFLGCIEYIMQGSGLQVLLGLSHAEGSNVEWQRHIKSNTST